MLPLIYVAARVPGREKIRTRTLSRSREVLVLSRVLADQIRRDAIEPACRDLVVRERIANDHSAHFSLGVAVKDLSARYVSSERVLAQHVARNHDRGKIAAGHPRSGNCQGVGQAAVPDQRPLVVGEPKRPVPGDRAADSGAELILLVRLPRLVVPVQFPGIGIQFRVLQELEQRTVDLVRAGLDRDIDDAACGAAVLGVVAVGQDLHLADSLDRGSDYVSRLVDEVDDVDVVVDAVEQEVVLAIRPYAVGREAAACRVARARLGRHDSRNRPRQERKAPLAAQWKLAGLAVLEGATHLGGFRLQGGRGGRNLDRLSDLADLEHKVGLHATCGLQDDAGLDRPLEARGLARDGV